jgi:hypothetical protein
MKYSFLKIIFQIFLYLFTIRKIDQRKIFFNQKKIWLGFQESLSIYFDGKHFSEVVKNSEISYYLLIISNLDLNLFVARERRRGDRPPTNE